MSNFVETECVFEHEGCVVAAGGAWLVDCTDGYRRGVVYAKPNHPDRSCMGVVTTWHGGKVAAATFGDRYRGPFCRMRSVRFVVDGVLFTGRWCPDWADAVRVRSTKRARREES